MKQLLLPQGGSEDAGPAPGRTSLLDTEQLPPLQGSWSPAPPRWGSAHTKGHFGHLKVSQEAERAAGKQSLLLLERANWQQPLLQPWGPELCCDSSISVASAQGLEVRRDLRWRVPGKTRLRNLLLGRKKPNYLSSTNYLLFSK